MYALNIHNVICKLCVNFLNLTDTRELLSFLPKRGHRNLSFLDRGMEEILDSYSYLLVFISLHFVSYIDALNKTQC